MENNVTRTICIVLCIICFFVFFGCETSEPITPDYEEFLSGFENDETYDDSASGESEPPDKESGEEEPEPPTVEEPFTFKVEGFMPLIEKAYDSIGVSSDGAIIAERGDSVYFISDGKETDVSFMLDDNFGETVNVSKNGIIAKRNDKLGLVGYDDSIIIPFENDEISLVNSTALAKCVNVTKIYRDGSLKITKTSGNYLLVGDNYFANESVADKIYSVDTGEVAAIGGFELVDAPYEGFAKIKVNGKIGYFDVNANALAIEPRYLVGSQFSGGVATVRASFSAYPKIIDVGGDVIFDFGNEPSISTRYEPNDINVYPRRGDYAFFTATRMGETDHGFIKFSGDAPTLTILNFAPQRYEAFGDYAVAANGKKLISLTENAAIDVGANAIVPTPFGFIVTVGESYDFIDFNLQPVVSGLERIEYQAGIFTIKTSEKYYVCRINEH